ncbi:MAG: methyltransferase [Myxococcota bacterium]|nr:methyltransferase [Myxococcota bacterium]
MRVEAVGFSPEGAVCRLLAVLPGGAPAGTAPAASSAGEPGPELASSARTVGPEHALAPGAPADEAIAPARRLVVPGLLPGEIATVELGREPAAARVRLLERPHPDRVPPSCPRFRDPAPCPLLVLPPAAQARVKVAMLEDALREAGLPDASGELLPLLSGPPFGYRAKAVFAVAPGREGPRLGYYAPGTQQLRPGTNCPLHLPAIAHLAATVEQVLRRVRLPAWQAGQDHGLRFVTVRAARQGGAWVLLTGGPATRPGLLHEAATRLLAQTGGELRTVWWSPQGQSVNEVVGEAPVCLAGRAGLWEQAGQIAVPLTPGAFHQASPVAGDLLIAEVRQAAAASGATHALDLFCGVGAYALDLAATGLTVTGVERDAAGIAAARRAAKSARLSLELVEADATAYLAAAEATPGRGELVVLNPPRRGAAPELLARLAARRPRRIVYVSCHPTTLARDLARLASHGYALLQVRPVDLLPQTAQVEAVAVCVPRD